MPDSETLALYSYVIGFASLVHAAGLWGSCGLFWLLDWRGWCEKHRIPRDDE